MKDELKSYERFQKAIFDAAQEPKDKPKEFVPYGQCRTHPWITVSNGMFDSVCPICESLNDGY